MNSFDSSSSHISVVWGRNNIVANVQFVKKGKQMGQHNRSATIDSTDFSIAMISNSLFRTGATILINLDLPKT
eukprot:scaffold404_cov54-Cylindrotheca_fusiformis.AAC.5